jgi:DNA-binding response OmpR family regulator
MKTTKVLLIESARQNGTASFAASLKRKKYDVEIAHSGKQGLALAADQKPDIVVLDAASLRTSGDRISTRLRELLGELPIIHIRPPHLPHGSSPADVLLTPPFTARKLINRIERYVVAPDEDVLQAGPFTLNVEQQTLISPWNEKKLTPKLAALMKLFMQQPGETLERKAIMQTIWDTDYMGDTRTLDVHIRWLRKVIEPEPRKPQYLVTVRGVGYCLEVTDAAKKSGKPESKKKRTSRKSKRHASSTPASDSAQKKSTATEGAGSANPKTAPPKTQKSE